MKGVMIKKLYFQVVTNAELVCIITLFVLKKIKYATKKNYFNFYDVV